MKFVKVMFSQVSVCLRGVSDTHPQAHTPIGQCMLGFSQQAGGMHPTGMHSCFYMQSRLATLSV